MVAFEFRALCRFSNHFALVAIFATDSPFSLFCSPAIPFNALNYIGGVLSITLEQYSVALIGLIPSVLLWVYVGATANQFSDHPSINNSNEDTTINNGTNINIVDVQLYALIFLSTGAAFGLLALILVWRFAATELRKEMDRNSAKSWFQYHKKTTLSSQQDKLATVEQQEQDCKLEDYKLDYYTPTYSSVLGFSGRELRVSCGPSDDRDEDWCWLFA